MGTLLKILLAVFAGVLLGLVVTIKSLDPDKLGVFAGPWRGIARDGSLGSNNPYALAADARAGLLPLGTSEGLSFIADGDTGGNRFDARCDYTIKGPMPPARAWSVSLLDAKGFPIANPAQRYAFTSLEVLRFVDEPVDIVASAHARAGNWLPIGSGGPFRLMLRLYDTSLSTTGSVVTADMMPRIEKGACRS